MIRMLCLFLAGRCRVHLYLPHMHLSIHLRTVSGLHINENNFKNSKTNVTFVDNLWRRDYIVGEARRIAPRIDHFHLLPRFLGTFWSLLGMIIRRRRQVCGGGQQIPELRPRPKACQRRRHPVSILIQLYIKCSRR